MPVILAVGRQRKAVHEIEANLSYRVKFCLGKKSQYKILYK